MQNNNHIFLVERNHRTSQRVVQWLIQSGYMVTRATSYESAIRRLMSVDANLVIADACSAGCSHPKMTNALAHVRALHYINRILEARSNLPVVVMTAVGDMDEAINMLKLGVSDYLVKPFSPVALITSIGCTLNSTTQQLDTPQKRVEIIPITEQLIPLLNRDMTYIYQLNPDEFEQLICDRLAKMGFEIQRTKSVYARDGGVDIIAYPKWPTPFPYLIAVQAKHHKGANVKTGPGPVKDLHTVVSTGPFQAGLLVTNTSFSPNARWFAAHRPHIVRLRDLEDLKRWISNNFLDLAEWREIPPVIELSPDVAIKLPIANVKATPNLLPTALRRKKK